MFLLIKLTPNFMKINNSGNISSQISWKSLLGINEEIFTLTFAEIFKNHVNLILLIIISKNLGYLNHTRPNSCCEH